MIVAEVLLVFEEGFLGNELVKDVVFHSFPPPIYTTVEGVTNRLTAMSWLSPSPPYMPVHGSGWKTSI